jgi:hypothetical protein
MAAKKNGDTTAGVASGLHEREGTVRKRNRTDLTNAGAPGVWFNLLFF